MKILKSKLKEIIREELKTLTEAKRWKVYIDGESKPFIIGGKNEKDVKKTAHAMTYPSRIKIKKIVKEGKLSEDFGSAAKHMKAYSSKEAKNVIDGALKTWAKDIRKVEGRVVKDWMSKAKAGVIDYFDLVRGLETGDVARAHPYETKFFKALLDRDKIMNRFRSYFKGKKGKQR